MESRLKHKIKTQPSNFEISGLKYILIFPILNSPKQTISFRFLPENLRPYMF